MRGRTITLVILAAALIGLAAGSLATAAGGWRVFAFSVDSDPAFVEATAQADAPKSKVIGVRASKPALIHAQIICEYKPRKVAAGRVFRLTVAGADKCNVFGSARSATAKTIRVQLLRR